MHQLAIIIQNVHYLSWTSVAGKTMIGSLLKHGAGENGRLLTLERKRFRVFLSSLQYPFSVWWQISGKIFLQRW